MGAEEILELGKPYDLLVRLNGTELHIEVKGSTRVLNSVILTRNEVSHAHQHPHTELYVVDQIHLETDNAGKVSTSGGRTRVWAPWAPSDDTLTPTVFLHRLQ
ncbi:protein NO VEIN domain-containing protein [Salinibacterium hongtaonis]|uniref:protein NO VEIN domain-containing protein n=1 Tax=Homoserinimonas hongtaonis TaxID=2079791 RepID=UPI003BB11849